MSRPRTYTVIGLLAEDGRWQRWAGSFEATTVEEAEYHARAEAESDETALEIAGVVRGDVKLADTHRVYGDEGAVER